MEEMTRRELAFCYIYSQEIQKQNSKEEAELFLDSLGVESKKDREFVINTADGINQNNEIITALIAKNLKKGWTIDRISTIDLALLKFAIYEINYIKTPFKIVINEVVNMAKKYGEDNSQSFVNGVLASIVAEEQE